MNLLPELQTKEIKNYIGSLISFSDASDFESLSDIHKDHLIGLGLKALDNDIDIVINADATKNLSRFLLSRDPDDQIELMRSLKQSAYESLGNYFDNMITTQKETRL